MTPPPASLSPQDALVAIMIATSASDAEIRTVELVAIQQIVNYLPAFTDYDVDRIGQVAAIIFDLFEEEDGLDTLLALVRDALPERLHETAYALACDVAAADGKLEQAELRFLQEIRHELGIERLNAAAIERAARARHMKV